MKGFTQLTKLPIKKSLILAIATLLLGIFTGWSLHNRVIGDSLEVLYSKNTPTEYNTIKVLTAYAYLQYESVESACLQTNDINNRNYELDQQSLVWAKLIGESYNENKQLELYSTLKTANTAAIDYTAASKAQDRSTMGKALTELTSAPGKIGKLYAELDDKISTDLVRNLFSEYYAIIKNIADSCISGDHKTVMEQQRAAVKQMERLAIIQTHYLKVSTQQ